MSLPHHPIMVDAILAGLQVAERENAYFVDGTLGAGGHTHAMLSTRPDNYVLGLDRDPDALKIAGEHLAEFGNRATLVYASYIEMQQAAAAWLKLDAPKVDGILLDLGVSSMQFDRAERGFAFRLEGPLDMRFDPSSGTMTAAELVNSLSEKELADLFFQYGEENDSRRMARQIVASRPIHTTTELANLIANLYRSHGPRPKIHPATRVFQALRIAVNDELGAVEAVLPIAINLLKPGGRLAILTFHSLEDRIVKQYFRQESTDCLCPSHQPICTCNHQASIRHVNRKPIEATDAEIDLNPRARSAKLRIAERL
ncbi:MAG: 16S rRNA (cytosine(1402)-N(4))-methyltransferase RsmH [Anaerolineae bacterium]|nr:16S rRNA (cytosine(1402)-N(4))-methyltransferase RsmH [Anaerolineae bacterium]